MDKENHPTYPSPLREKQHNIKTAREEFRYQKHDQILMALQEEINTNTTSDFFQVMLADPLLKELNNSLEK